MTHRAKFGRRDPRKRLLRTLSLAVVTAVCSSISALAAAPTVTNNSLTLATGAQRPIYLNNSATWTGSVPTLTYTVLDMPQHGRLTRSGYIVYYTADQPIGYIGQDSFTWFAAGGGETSQVATCTVTVNTNCVPVARNFSMSVKAGGRAQSYLSSYVTHSSADAGQTMTYQASQPAHGTVSVDSAWRAYYTPAAGFIGVDAFTWTANDRVDTSAPGTCTVTVTSSLAVTNNAAVAVKNTPLVIHPLVTGTAGFDCVAVKVSGPGKGALQVTNGMCFLYRPTANYVGNDSFKWRIDYSNSYTPVAFSATATCSIVVRDASTNASWTQWRFDETRSAKSSAILPDRLSLRWQREVPSCAASFNGIKDLDYCRPVQMGKTLFVSLMANDSVTAYDTDTGAQKWRYYTSGALRRPPVALRLRSGQAAWLTNDTDVVIVPCDDGYVYCLNAGNGSELWKFRAAPNSKKAMGCGRLGSVWPLWGSPVAYNGRVYFTAGYIPSFGIYGYCLDAATGNVVWRNDGKMMGSGGISSIGPLAFSCDHTKMYGAGMSGPGGWVLDPATGEKTANAGVRDALWFVDGNRNYEQTEPVGVTAGGYTFTPASVAEMGVTGTVHSILAGDGKLFVVSSVYRNVTREYIGNIHCFSGDDAEPLTYPRETTSLPAIPDGWTTAVQNMLSKPDRKQGLALVWGVGTGRLVEEMTRQATNLMIVAVDPDPVKLRALRDKMDAAGVYGARVSTIEGNPMDCGFAPYQAGLIASEDLAAAGFANGSALVKILYSCTRPFGGEVWLPSSDAQHAQFMGWFNAATNMPLCQVTRETGFTRMTRTGLPAENVIFKPPFGLTAFGGFTISSYSVPVNGTANMRDVYTWLPAMAAMPGYEPAPATNNLLLDRYADLPRAPTTYNPVLSGVEKSSSISVFTSCSGVKQYGGQLLYLGKTTHLGYPSRFWGLVSIPEIGGCCGPNGFMGDGVIVIQAAGYGGCNYNSFQLTQIGLTPMADEENDFLYQYYSTTREIQEKPIRRIGVNFGGSTDWHVPEEEMLWTHHPSSGRAMEVAPLIPVTYRGNAKSVYHHSAQIEKTGNRYRGWVSASQVTGMDGLSVHLATPLVAMRTATAPALDGQLTDACWDGLQKVVIPVKGIQGCEDPAYAMIRYDDVNLYVGGGLRGLPGLGDSRIRVLIKGRERASDAPLVFTSSGYWKNSAGTLYTAELAIPWATLEAAGLWRGELLMALDIFAYSPFRSASQIGFGPLSLDTARGFAMTPRPYNIRLYFAEVEDKTAGQRVFDVKMQGQTVLASLDVVTQAGGPRRELVKEFTGVQIREKLDVDFVRCSAGDPMLSGVEIMAAYADSDIPNTPPVAVIDANILSGPAPLEVNFSARRSSDPDGQIVECAWETGDGRLARGSLMRHVFAEPGTYKVNLLVTDNRGGAAATNVTVTAGPGNPSAFVCKIRSSGGDYTNLATWETAIQSDLASASTFFGVSSVGTYTTSDNGKTVVFSGGATGVLRWVTNTAPASAVVASVGGTGTVQVGTVKISSGHTFTISDTGVPTKSLLFSVSNRGGYAPAADDGKSVTFTGGGVGTLKHINTGNLAYVTECRGTIQAGTVTCASGHTFEISGAGSPIVTAVAECYHDWPGGLSGKLAVAGWIVDENHCVTIRAANGHGHKGKLQGADGKYTGFTMLTSDSLDAGYTPFTRIERIAIDSGRIIIDSFGSVNRVCGNVSVQGTGATVANSIAGAFSTVNSPKNVSFYNCTATNFSLSLCYELRMLNCLSAPGAGFSNGSRLYYRGYCISPNGTATNFYVSEQDLGGNCANASISFVDTAKKDYHLALTDTGARGRGQPGLGADIDGDERVGPDYDIGADQTFGNHAPRILAGPTATPEAVGTGAVVRFSVAAGDYEGDPLVYSWVFGDGDGTYGTNATHVYATTGTYTVRVAVADGMLASTGTVTVTVLGAFDAWLVEYFGSTNAPTGGAGDDADRDGMSNVQEFLAGTDPLNAGSALELTSVAPAPGGNQIVLVWRSESNKWYWIGRATNLITGFEPVVLHIPATYPVNTHTISVDEVESGFFKITLEQ